MKDDNGELFAALATLVLVIFFILVIAAIVLAFANGV